MSVNGKAKLVAVRGSEGMKMLSAFLLPNVISIIEEAVIMLYCHHKPLLTLWS